MLLVGLRHSGKTTVIKQLQQLYCDHWSPEMLKRYTYDVLERCIVALKATIRNVSLAQLQPALREQLLRVEQLPSRASAWSSDLLAVMRRVWSDPVAQQAFLAAADDADAYFLTNVERFASDSFVPLFADVVRLHDKPHRRNNYVRSSSGSGPATITRGVQCADFTRLPPEVLVQVCRLLPYNDLVQFSQANVTVYRLVRNTPLLWKGLCQYHFNLPVNHSSFGEQVDWRRTFVSYLATHSAHRVSGVEESTYQLGECHVSVTVIGSDQLYSCRKWTNFLENVDAMLFCVDLCTYDQPVPGSPGRTALHECLSLFEAYLRSPWFARTRCVLLFNKRDRLQRKLAKGPDLSVCFGDYKGGRDLQAAIDCVQRKFVQHTPKSRRITTHVLSATDPQHVRTVFESIHGMLAVPPG